jgi:hypothetical protein
MWTTFDRFSEPRWEERHRDPALRERIALARADECEGDDDEAAVPTVRVAEAEEES